MGTTTFSLTRTEVAEFARDGFIGPFQLFDEDEALELAEQMLELVKSPGPNFRNEEGVPDNNSCRHFDTRFVRDICMSPQILDRLESLLGPDLLLFLNRIWTKRPGGLPVPWHQDMTHFPMFPHVGIATWIAFTEQNEANGCLSLIPGSQRSLLGQTESGLRGRGFALMTSPEEMPEV